MHHWMKNTLCAAVLGVMVAEAAGQAGVCQVDKLLASDGAALDQFGVSVSISGDVAVVGAVNDDDLGSTSGSAFVYRFDGSSWVQEQKLLAPDGAAGDEFGYSVSVDGDVALIGATGDDDNGDRSGSTYVFRFNGASWVPEQKLLAADGGVLDGFGGSVSISGDVAVVGASYHDLNGIADVGSAYVFRFTDSTWTPEQKLLAADGAQSDNFGWSVSVSGDVTVVSAVFDDDNGTDSGSAYVYRYNGLFWEEEQKLLASDGATFDFFGWSVSLSGDGALVGSRFDDDNGAESGSVYAYRFNGSSWVQEQKLLASDGVANQLFGQSVALSGDVAVVGAPGDDDNGTGSGSAYGYRFDGSTWVEEQKVTSADGVANDLLGWSVSLSGDAAVLGAQQDDDNGDASGSAYVFGGFGDCNLNGFLDCHDILDGVSTDFNTNGTPDDCEFLAYNLVADTLHSTIDDAIVNAVFDDVIIASPLLFGIEPDIDFQGKIITLQSMRGVDQPAGGLYTLTDQSTLIADDGDEIHFDGAVTVRFGDRVDVAAEAVNVGPAGSMSFAVASVVDVAAPLGLVNHGAVSLTDASLGVTGGFLNDVGGELTASGSIAADLTNDNAATYVADTLVDGDYLNNGMTTVQNGTLTILGTLTNNGTIVGDVGNPLSGTSGAGMAVLGDLVIGSAASLRLSSPEHLLKVERDYDVAINDHTRYDLALAELRAIGLAEAVQQFECMSTDIGADRAGLDRTLPGHFPIGTLRIGPTPTTVDLVDLHDNDNLGQTDCEAIYVRALIIEPGAVLNTNGCPVYYETLAMSGAVDDPLNLIELPAPCLGDTNDDQIVDVVDLLAVLGAWGPNPGHAADTNGDGVVDIVDLLNVLGAWGSCF